MKLSFFALIISVVQVLAVNSYSQTTRLSLDINSSTIKEVLNQIEEKSEFYFIYDASLIDVSKVISIKVENKSVPDILDEIFKGSYVIYRIVDRQIAVTSKIPENSGQQKITVSGKVTDSTGAPLPGVSVVVKGTTTGIITDFDGKYTLANVPADATLIFSFVGMKTQEVYLSGQDNVNITLNEESFGVNEVVVVGYGTQKKINLTGAVSQVSAEKLENRPITSAAEGLQGLIPNLNITFESGEPGNNKAEFNVRGTTSINGGEPLILIDGVAMDIDLINPEDIQSVTVLKDAAAAAVYGSRAAFGVILVTTKQGHNNQKTIISYSGNTSFNIPTILPKFVKDSYTYATAVNFAKESYDGTPLYDDDYLAKLEAYSEDPENNPEWEIISGVFKYYGYTDWKKTLLRRSAPTQNHNINISGGTKNTSFYSSIGYLNKEGLLKYGTDEFDRINVNLSVDSKVNDWLSINMKTAFNNKTTNKPHVYDTDYIQSVVFSRPTVPFRYPGEGEYYGYYFESPGSYQALAGRDTYNSNDFWMTVGAELRPLNHLTIKTSFSYNIFNSIKQDHAKQLSFITANFEETSGSAVDDYLKMISQNKSYYDFKTYAEYENKFANKHYLKTTVGFDQELTKSKNHFSQVKDLINQELVAINLGTGEKSVGGSQNELALRGAMFRFNYIYEDKYLFEMNGRYDGSSKFPLKSRYGFFPSFSAGWRISQEKFMKHFTGFLDNLKLRGSYGILGSQYIGYWDNSLGEMIQVYYPYIPSMASGTTSYILGEQTELYIAPPGLVSPSLTWEKAATLDFGVDVSLFNSKIDFSFDWYQRTTTDMLMQMKYPDILGANAPRENAAELRNRGWELNFKWNDRLGQVDYGIELSLADSKAIITKYDNPTGSLSEYYEGKKIGEIWGYETQGIFQTEGELSEINQTYINAEWKVGDIRYKDLLTIDSDNDGIPDAGDGKINEGSYTLDDHGDLKVIGNSTPRYSFGINTNLKYKGWFLNIFFQGIGKRNFWPSSGAFWPYASPWYQVQTQFITDSWSETNQDSYFARPLTNTDKNRKTQSRYIQDASYIRLKNLTLGYDFNLSQLKQIGISKAKLYFSGQNLWEMTKTRKPYDPEAVRTGIEGSAYLYPFQRTYSIGINLTF